MQNPKEIKFTNSKPQNLSLRLLRFQGNPKLRRFSIGDFLPGVPGGNGNGDEGLGLTNGSALLELYVISDLELVVGVVGLELLLLPHAPLVLGVGG